MYNNRIQLEEIENKILAPYACYSSHSKGRVYPEDEPEYRTAFQRDRDRILHTTAFRRMEYKTQVFLNHEGDYYRTRLTHTLEVAQIGRTISRALGANEDLIEAICLAHDLGHPAFGHSGEATLSKLMKDFGGFDHNKQSLRIVTVLEKRFAEFPGLNLTWEVREGIVKHESEYDVSDASDYNPKLRGHIEAQIANVADEITYTAHDLDDGLRSGMITPRMLSGITIWEVLLENIGATENEFDDLARHQLIRKLIGIEVTNIVETTSKELLESKVKSVSELQQLDFDVVNFSEDYYRWNRELKDFLFKNLYRHYRVMRMAAKAERIITDLFKTYVSEPIILPDHIQKKINEYGLERTVCDYIAGMTDRFAIQEHQKLFDPAFKP